MDNLINNRTNIDKFIVRACYTGILPNLEKYYKYNNKQRKEIAEIIFTKNKIINMLIESFNKDTNFIFEEVFKNRNNYCKDDNDNCSECWMFSCETLKQLKELMEYNNKKDIFNDFIGGLYYIWYHHALNLVNKLSNY